MVPVLDFFLAVAPEQHPALKLRLDPTTLKRAEEIQEYLVAAGKNSSLTTVVGMAIDSLHHELFGATTT